MEKIDLFNLIESYLDNALPEEKRREVERRMAEDEAFRREVELHRGLQENFSDPGRWRLRSALAQAMEESLPPDESASNPKPGFPNSRWKWIIFLALIFAGIGIWYWLRPPTGKSSQQPIETQPTEQHSSPVPGVEKDTVPVETPTETVPLKQQPEENLPIAAADPADFIPNISMEAAVSSGVRSKNMDVKISSPSNGADFRLNEKREAIVLFAGRVEGISETEPEAFALAVFNNKDATKPLFSVPLEWGKDAAGWAFEVRQPLKFQPGLYYFTIEQEGEVVYAGKFTIGKLKK